MDAEYRELIRKAPLSDEDRERLRAISIRTGFPIPHACFRIDDLVMQHSCSASLGYGPWKCFVVGFEGNTRVPITKSIHSGTNYTGCEKDPVVLLEEARDD